jgi:hypothetical protein
MQNSEIYVKYLDRQPVPIDTSFGRGPQQSLPLLTVAHLIAAFFPTFPPHTLGHYALYLPESASLSLYKRIIHLSGGVKPLSPDVPLSTITSGKTADNALVIKGATWELNIEEATPVNQKGPLKRVTSDEVTLASKVQKSDPIESSGQELDKSDETERESDIFIVSQKFTPNGSLELDENFAMKLQKLEFENPAASFENDDEEYARTLQAQEYGGEDVEPLADFDKGTRTIKEEKKASKASESDETTTDAEISNNDKTTAKEVKLLDAAPKTRRFKQPLHRHPVMRSRAMDSQDRARLERERVARTLNCDRPVGHMEAEQASECQQSSKDGPSVPAGRQNPVVQETPAAAPQSSYRTNDVHFDPNYLGGSNTWSGGNWHGVSAYQCPRCSRWCSQGHGICSYGCS